MTISAFASPLLACVLIVSAGCRTRVFNAGSKGSSTPLAHFIEDTVPFEKRPPMDYSLDTRDTNAGKTAGDPAALLSPLSYQGPPAFAVGPCLDRLTRHG